MKFKIKDPKPAGLTVVRNDHGAPQIVADEIDGCMWGIGYCHATDRTTQLLMMRILGQGRICELLDDSEESLAIDTFFRRANWQNNIDQQVSLLDEKSRNTCQAYCDGVNAGLAARKIYVLKLMGYRPDPWTIADCILLMRMTAYLTLAQSQTEVERFFVEMVQAGVDSIRLAELFPVDAETLDRQLISDVELGERIVPGEIKWNMALPRMMASNNWVVAGNNTASGAAIMANDPHLEINRLPNVWYEQSVRWTGTDSQAAGYIMGMGMPGLPGVLVGRNKHVAWGATYTFMDTVDSWIEECRDGSCRRGDGWEAFQQRKETIKRKKNADVDLVYYESSHGVLDGDPRVEGKYLSTRWSAAEAGARTLVASLKLPVTTNAEEAMHRLGAIESAWNWVIADDSGNIAYQMSGLMPIRNKNWSGFSPAPGWDAAYDWKGFVDISDLPRCLNPANGYIATANQDLNHLGVAKPINMPMGNYRARRIEHLLASRNDHDFESMHDIQLDVYSGQARLFLDVLMPLLDTDEQHAAEKNILRHWNLEYDLESQGAALFECFYSALRQQVFGKSGLGEEVVKHLSDQTGLFIDFYRNFDRVMLNELSAWHTDQTRDESFVAAFEAAVQNYDGKAWKEKNAVTFVNQLFQGKLPAFLGFDSKAIALPGGRATPQQGQIYVSNGRVTSFAPSVRMVTDMAEENIHTCVAGGPSDNRFSKWYASGIQDWVNGDYNVLKPG